MVGADNCPTNGTLVIGPFGKGIMYLKRLKVRNFKSFAGATEIPFQPGFTGVAGPNGMGKSNISDAILFVLGPTSSKALRADRLTHLFFNGGSSKKPATECEVTLVFENRDRLLPAETDEVEITRYVKLAPSDANGYYSYFYVNGRRSTQSEIDSLLSHARLSGDGYNLVQQGDVNRIVSMGPVPRRGLVERLAGISQYDEELERAEAKRVDLETNLGRITALLSEIRGRIASLESQRLQAIQYRQLQEQKRVAEARLARAGHQLARQEVASCEAQLKKLEEELRALRDETAQLASDQSEINESIERLEKEIARQGGAEAAKFKAELDERRMAFARLDENVRSAEEELTALRDRIATFSGQVESDRKEIAALRTKETALATKAKAAAERADSLAAELKDATSRTDPSQGHLAGTRKEVLQTERDLAETQQKWEALVAAREGAKVQLASAERDLAIAQDEHRTRELEVKDVELRIREAAGAGGSETRSSQDLQKELFQTRSKEANLRGEGERLAREVLELNRRYMALDARLKVRAEKGGGSGVMAAVDFLLSQRNLGKISGIRGTVQELVSFDEKHATALSVAGGGRFQALVVETDQVAEECIRLLRAERRGRATFLPLNKVLPGRPKGKSLIAAQSPGSIGFAIDLARFDEDLRPALWYVFGETVVMSDLAHAREQMGGVRLVTLTGELIEATGAITGGSLDLAKGPGSDNAAELRRIGAELRERTASEEAARAELEKLSERVRTLSEELAKRSGQSESRQQAQDLLAKEAKGARERLAEVVRKIRTIEAAEAGARSALGKAEAESERVGTTLRELQERRERLQKEFLGGLPAALSKKIQSLHEQNQVANEARVAAAGELESLRASLAAAEKALEGRQEELSGMKATSTEKAHALQTLTKNRDAAKSSLEALRSVEQKQSARVQGLSEERRQEEAKRLAVVGRLGTCQEALRTKTDLSHNEEVRLATARAHLAEVEAALRELPEAPADETPIPVEELKRTIQTLQAQLDGMGSVNLLALEEYDREKARLGDFEGEVDRLGHEKAELLELVGEIEKKKREKLTEVVGHVNAGYREIYADLSGGGEGEIALENPSNPLAGGLLIKARPIGKNVQRLEQLSGGEKSLASLAFVFALQRHDPSPLYVFDEVDMSLDGVNAENVGRMLRRNAERAQFVVISLRKVTLKFAHQLFGVTMRGDGCSRVVGLSLDEIIDVDERERAAEGSRALPVVAAPPPGAA